MLSSVCLDFRFSEAREAGEAGEGKPIVSLKNFSLSPHQPQPSNVKNIHLKGGGMGLEQTVNCRIHKHKINKPPSPTAFRG